MEQQNQTTTFDPTEENIAPEQAVTSLAELKAKEEPKASLEDQAASAFSQLMPIWKRLRKSMNYGSYARVTSALMEFPLADEYPKFKNQQELEAFKMGCTIMDAKNIMISSTFEKRFSEKKLKTFEFNEEETINKEKENGSQESLS